jgi:hypothetical protein
MGNQCGPKPPRIEDVVGRSRVEARLTELHLTDDLEMARAYGAEKCTIKHYGDPAGSTVSVCVHMSRGRA